MGYPRCHLVDSCAPGGYHVVSRCVRRAWLCGHDELTGQSYEHRRQWVEDRIHHLADCFALGVMAYAVMSNHLHLVVYLQPSVARSWDDDEVVSRWRRVFPVRGRKTVAALVSPERIALWRERLGSLSWFMRALVEPIAREANREDRCTGRFWEGRFRCQALLDERSILAAMAYVDLNPVRAGIADSLAGSPHTSVAERLRRWTRTTEPANTPAGSADPEPRSACAPPQPEDEPRTGRLCAVAGLREALPLPLSEASYVDLVAWSGAVPGAGKACLPGPDAALRYLGCSMVEWQEQLSQVRSAGRAMGGSEQMRALAQRLQQCWIQRRRRPSWSESSPPSTASS